MCGLIKLYYVFSYILVFTVPFVLAQVGASFSELDKAPVIRECGKDNSTTRIDPVLKSVPLLIRNYNFAYGSYRNSEDCQIHLLAENRPLVLNVTFKLVPLVAFFLSVFELEAESKCRMDYLCINGVNFCGSWEVNKTFNFKLPAHRSFTMRFMTDSSITRRGFEIRVDARETDEQTHFPEVSQGYGSAEELLVLTIPNKGAYRDRCLPGKDHLRHESEFIPNKSDTTSTDGSDWTTSDYQSSLSTDYHKYDFPQKPVQKENLVHDITSNPHQTDNYTYDNTPASFQTDNFNYDTTQNPLQTDDFNNDTNPNPLQTDEFSYDIMPNPLQTDEFNDDTNTNPLQTDDFNDDTNTNPLQTDDFNDNDTLKLLQKENLSHDTTPNPFQKNNTSDDTTSNPLDRNKPALNPLQTNTSSYDTTSDPLQTDTPTNGTTPIPFHTYNSSYDTTQDQHPTDNPSYDTTKNPHVTGNRQNEPTLDQHKPNLPSSDTPHALLHHVVHLKNHTTDNPLQTTQLGNIVTPSPNETSNARKETTPSPHQRDSISNNTVDSASENDPPMSYDTAVDALDAAVYLETHTPVIVCSSYIQPVYINSSNTTYLVRNAGFGTRPYYNDEQCSVEFHISYPARLVTVKFLYLDLERNPWCSYDSLCVGGDMFCDSSETGHAYSYVVPAGQTFTLAFTTDVSNTGNGFEVEVDIQDAIESLERHKASADHGPGLDSIRQQFSNMGSYVDRCSFNPVVQNVTSKFDTTVPHDESTYFGSESTEEGHRTTNNEHITDYTVNTSESGYQTIGRGYKTTNREYHTTEKGYQTADKNYETIDKGYETTENSYQITEKSYKTTDKVYQTTDKVYQTTDEGYQTTDKDDQRTDKGDQTTDKDYQTTDKGYHKTGRDYQTTDNGSKTKEPMYKTSESLYQTKATDDQGLDNSEEVTSPDIQTTDDISGSKDNYSVATRNPWVKTSVIYCGDQPSTVNIIHKTSKYIVKSGQQEHRTGYTNNERCLVVYGTTTVPKMFAVTFKIFDIEYHQNCCYDFLCMKGVKFCGDWAEGYSFRYVVPAYSTFTLAFSTDESKSGQGFEMEITITDPPADTQIAEVSSGVGSREASLKYKPSNISDYTDKCQHPIPCISDHASSSTFPQKIIPDSTTIRQVLSPDPSYLAQHLRVILRMIGAAQERISYAYDLLTSLI